MTARISSILGKTRGHRPRLQLTRRNTMLRTYFILTLIVIAASTIVITAQQTSAGIYTAQQAAAGNASYQANCAGCHQQDLSGSGDAPPLRGTQFVTNWGPRTTRELLSFMQLTMPPARPGAMSADEYAGIVAFILQSNGVAAGNQQLTVNTEVRINSLAMGQAPARPAQAAAARPPAQPKGVTVAGEVKNYLPVTDAMLLNPNPNDW